ncbi:MAG: IPT/TIG domain-containing protein [Candidatus Obscuribacterales bacterium]|nr:IPT/TIG domain-containing protein [Candidatus Obscuribacterales bacterium]
MSFRFRRLFFSVTCTVVVLAGVLLPVLAAPANIVTLFRSKDYLSRSYQVQNFQDTLSLQPSQQNLPLSLNLYNGSHEAPSFKWFRLIIGGYTLATEKNLNGREEGSIDVTGQIPGGDTQIMVEAGGVPGASLIWTLTTPRVTVDRIEPQSIKAGDTVTIYGTNFSAVANQNMVLFNNKQAQVLSASTTQLQVKAPANLGAGIDSVQVNTNNLVANAMEIMATSLPVPELLSTDCWMAPPGGNITITGRNFRAGTKVYFQDVQAQVVSQSATQLVVIVPAWSYGNSLNIPLTVVSDGVRSKNSIPFDIGPMYHGAIPTVQPD